MFRRKPGGKLANVDSKVDLYLVATGIAEKSDKVKCATFLHVAGDDAIKVFNTMDLMMRMILKSSKKSLESTVSQEEHYVSEAYVFHESTGTERNH